tara:strand:+ start:6589 stop:7650 length:1062 start_codon:yes stop_codon:yes gene_type:complete
MINKILISTGGSGGHVIPAMILYEHLSKKNELFICTDKRGSKFLDKDSYKIEIINTPKLNRIFLFPLNLFIILFLTIKSLFLLKEKKINILFSTGGYMSLPLMLAAKILNLKIYLLEPNLVLGRANRFFLKSCKKILCYTNQIKNFPKDFFKKIVTIHPLVRKDFYENINNNSKEEYNILVIGGSQGANIFDKRLKHIIVNLSKEFSIKIIQQTNKKNISNLREYYSKNKVEHVIFDFEKNLINKIWDADLCITRAGASSLAELSISQTPFIAIPLPKSKDDHQFENANFYKKKECCWIINQNIFEEEIEHVLRNIFQNKTDLMKKKENLKKLNYQNTWINVNQKLLDIINEN